MRRIIAFVLLLTLMPSTAALATDLDELLDRGHEATYSAEQIISCSTPDGDRDALVQIDQVGDEIRVSSSVRDNVEVVAGAGGWTLSRGGGLVFEATVDGSDTATDPLYTVEDKGAVEYLGRAAMAYMLIREGEPRAELVIDDETGAVVKAVTLTVDDDVYCERRFVSLSTEAPEFDDKAASATERTAPATIESSSLPELVTGFQLLDRYEDEDGFTFVYYSDGFFSFALFDTPKVVALPEAAVAEFDHADYQRVFTAGQVAYVWETRDGGMALVGDLPPDMHEAILSEMPHPQDPGFFRRWWRNLFG
ncbi:MAG TPA: hypothetical protein VK969_12465 [Acidimicrobiia bacterium]|nr:hypothetical protein [Acidimicrobiia bacterium]